MNLLLLGIPLCPLAKRVVKKEKGRMNLNRFRVILRVS